MIDYLRLIAWYWKARRTATGRVYLSPRWVQHGNAYSYGYMGEFESTTSVSLVEEP